MKTAIYNQVKTTQNPHRAEAREIHDTDHVQVVYIACVMSVMTFSGH
jgi:hypothetical protein